MSDPSFCPVFEDLCPVARAKKVEKGVESVSAKKCLFSA